MKKLKEYISEGILDIADSNRANESLLDMDEEAADKAVVDSVTKKLIKNYNSISIYGVKYDCYDAIGREVNIGDMVINEHMEIGIVMGFEADRWASDNKTIIISTDGEQHEHINEKGAATTRNGEFLLIPNIKSLKKLIEK